MSTDMQPDSASVRQRHGRTAVVVGVDGSERNASAVDYAVAAAATTERPLVLVAVVDDYVVPIPHHSTRPDGRHDWEVLTRLADTVQAGHPGLEVRRELQFGSTVDSLLLRSVDQDSLVVGKRGLGSFGRMLVGSTSIAVAGRSRVPVVIVPDGWRQEENRDRPVVVGLSLGEKPDTELRYAFTQAAARGVPLRIVHALNIEPVLVFDPVLEAATYRHWEKRDAAQLDEVVAPFRDMFPTVDVVIREQRGHPGSVLLDQSGLAQLIVLGRHHAGRYGFGLGSVARGVLHYSDLPVAVVPSGC